MRSIMAVWALLVAGIAFAIDPNAPGDLSVTVFVSPTDKFIEEWFNTPAEHGPTIKRIKDAKFDQLVHVGFVITGHTAGENGRAAVDVDVRVVYPKGDELFRQDKFARYDGAPKQAAFVFADPVLQLMIESTDPAGQYTIRAIIHDNVTGKTATGEASLNITP